MSFVIQFSCHDLSWNLLQEQISKIPNVDWSNSLTNVKCPRWLINVLINQWNCWSPLSTYSTLSIDPSPDRWIDHWYNYLETMFCQIKICWRFFTVYMIQRFCKEFMKFIQKCISSFIFLWWTVISQTDKINKTDITLLRNICKTTRKKVF